METDIGDVAEEERRAVDGRTRTSEPTGGGGSAAAGSTSAMVRDGPRSGSPGTRVLCVARGEERIGTITGRFLALPRHALTRRVVTFDHHAI